MSEPPNATLDLQDSACVYMAEEPPGSPPAPARAAGPAPARTRSGPAPVVVTYEQIRLELFPRFFGYAPPMRTLRRWLTQARLRKIKTNPRARGGGGVVHFNRRAIKDWLRRRTGL